MTYSVERKEILSYERYYSLVPEAVGEGKPYAWYRDELSRRLDAAVGRWMVADVPVSCFLSGGVDSSVIALLAKRRAAELDTFSMGFETTNELPHARLVAAHLKTRHHELMLDSDGVLGRLDTMVAHMDEPVGDPGFLPVLVLSEEVKRHAKVVLSGDGGDEVLTGYDRYKLLRYGLGSRGPGLRHLAVHHFGSDIMRRLRSMRGKDEYGAFVEIVRLFESDELKRLGVGEHDARPLWDEATRGFATPVERAQAFDIATLLPGDFFMKADKMSSAYGLEQRTPFLDHELVEFCFAIPLPYKLRLWNEKRILKDAFARELPRSTTRRRKQGFNVPIDHWFKGALGTRLETLLRESTHGLYDKRYALELLERMRRKGKNYKENFILAQKLWSLLVFEMWYAALSAAQAEETI